MSTLLERSAKLTIGTIDSVAPAELSVQLEIDAPHATALNTGIPVPFPRINSYVLVPSQTGAVVGQVTWIGIERSEYPKRKGLRDFGIVDLPFPLRRLKFTPIGMLRLRTDPLNGRESILLERGISLFPSVGDIVALPTADQLRAIVEVAPELAPVTIGRSALADGAPIRVHPDRLFGRHVAILGNTGSGKSCTVAGVIRWCIESADRVVTKEPGASASSKGRTRFIVLDPNGEYAGAFPDLRGRVRVFRPPTFTHSDTNLLVPAWLLNYHEWSAILQAAPGVQQPVLMESLRRLRAANAPKPTAEQSARKALASFVAKFESVRENPAPHMTSNAGRMETGATFNGLLNALNCLADHIDPSLEEHRLIRSAAQLVSGVAQPFNAAYSRTVPSDTDLQRIAAAVALHVNPQSSQFVADINADSPTPFDVRAFPAALVLTAMASGDAKALQHITFMLGRLQALLRDSRITPIIDSIGTPSLPDWLTGFLSDNPADHCDVAIIDLSLVPSDISHILVAVITRVVFEALQRYHKVNGAALPTVLVADEAHTFIQRGRDDPSDTPSATQMCRRTFERIAREGRKFGLGLVLASQRPSEISPTVLSQCNTFILHRIVNDEDQNLVRKLIPDSLGALLRELPMLHSQHAILLGHATEIPKMVVINDLEERFRPKSNDPAIWDVWTLQQNRLVDWEAICRPWTGVEDPDLRPGSSDGAPTRDEPGADS